LRILRVGLDPEAKSHPDLGINWTTNAILITGQQQDARSWYLVRKKWLSEKMGVVIEETDEAAFWLELLVKLGFFRESQLKALLSEANPLVAIFVSSRRTVLAAKQQAEDIAKLIL
jgi:hypothetical protein